MRKKLVLCLLSLVTLTLMLTGCNSKTEEVEPTQTVEVKEEVVNNTEVPISNQLSDIVGYSEEAAKAQIDNLSGLGGFKYWVDENDGVVYAAATASYDLSVLSIYPGTITEGAIESLLSNQWSFKAEYLWYAINGDKQCLYSSGVYEKDNHEIVLTTKNGDDMHNVDILEYIDVDLVKKDAENNGEQFVENTAFAHIHHIN